MDSILPISVLPFLFGALISLLFFKSYFFNTPKPEPPQPVFETSQSESRSYAPDKTRNLPRKYDVFLSFRGADTRKGFTDHLYASLVRAGIHTFRDDNEIEHGEEIGPECLKAIEESKFSIVVLSKGYASSTWCLDELEHILKCRKEMGHGVRPVFYDVDPSDVEEQTGSFAKAFAEHEKHFKKEINRVERWRSALKEVAYLKGLDLPKHEDGHEARNIDNIIQEILDKLDMMKLSVPIHPVDLDSPANGVISLLGLADKSACMVGIFGIGGIGKTTIAKEVYCSIFDKFEGSCFLENVREKSEPKDVVKLQRQLLSETLKRKYGKIYNVNQGVSVIEERLRHKRVLLILDDVDEVDQLNYILGSRSWLFPGSRVIITTRTKDLLNPSMFYRQYDVQGLRYENALQLLSLHAFDKCHPLGDYVDCAKEAVDYAGGIPLALEVLGSSLHGQGVDVWNSRLKRLKAYGDKKIHKILETSYYSLDVTDQFLFLDIACFFVGKDKDCVMSILEECDFFPTDGINTLMKRCLLTVGSHNKLLMHSLLRDMGRAIVQQESRNPGERSRIWRYGDAIDLLKDQMGTNKVEGLVLDVPGLSVSFNAKAFKYMKRLRALQLNNVHLAGSFERISRKLVWLCWQKFPYGSIPTDLHLSNLVALDMRYSKLKQFSEEVKFLGKLKFLNLSHSHELIKTPNFESIGNLEKLILKDCISLVEVHDSIRLLTRLVMLNLQECKRLKNLPGSIGSLRYLEKLNVSSCTEIKELPDSIGFLSRLVFLDLQDCTSLQKLPRSIGSLRSLENLNMSGCSKLDEMPEELGNVKSLVVLVADGTSIRTLPETIGNLENLKILSLRECRSIVSLSKSPNIISFLPSFLEQLDLRYCNLSDNAIPNEFQGLFFLKDLKLCGNNFTSLPASIGSLPRLNILWLNECKGLKSVPVLQPSLIVLYANDCASLESINLTNHETWELQLKGCHKLKNIEGYFNLQNIEVEVVEKLLRTCVSCTQESIAGVKLHMINTLTGTHRMSPIQALCERSIYSIFLPGSEIPRRFHHQTEGDMISLHVPSLEQGSKIIGFVMCTIYAWEKPYEPCCFFPHVTVINKTKVFNWVCDSKVAFFSSEVEQDIMWLSYWMFDNHTNKEHTDNSDTRWIFWKEMEEGDHVDVSIDLGYGIIVRKCGVNFLYQSDVDLGSHSNDLATISCATSRHNRRFLKSHPHWLAVNSQGEITSQRWVYSFTNSTFQAYSSWFKKMPKRREEVNASSRH